MTDNNSHTASSSSFPPSGWVETTLGEVIDFVVDNRGKTPPLVENGYELLEVNAVSDNAREPDYSKVSKFVDEETFRNGFRKGTIKKGDVLIPTVGTIGNASYSKLDRGAIAQNLIALRANTENDSLFLYYFLTDPNTKKALLNLDIGGVQPSIKVPHLLGMQVVFPSLPEQQAIASVLSAFDDKIELLREQNKTLEEMGQVIFQEWFGKYGVDDELPEGWRVGKLGEIDFISFGDGNYSSKYPKQEDFVENGIPFISNKDISNGVINPNDLRYISEQQHNSLTKGHLKENDILISTRANIGDIALVSKQFENANINAQLVYIRTNNPKLYTKFLYIMFSSKKFKSIFESFSSGSAQSQLPMHALRQIEIVVPNNEILESFSETVNPIFQKMSDNFSQIQSLARSRDELLPRLMNSEVRVNF